MASIYAQDDCVICLDSLHKCHDPCDPCTRKDFFTNNEILTMHTDLTDDIYELSLRQYSVENERVTLECNHVFHMDCFFMYVKKVYQNYTTNVFDRIVFLQCPLCRTEVSKCHLKSILQSFKQINDMDNNLITLTERLRAKILYKKFIMYAKKMFGKDNMTDVQEFNRLNIIYDETSDFERRIRQNIRDVKTIDDNLNRIVFLCQ